MTYFKNMTENSKMQNTKCDRQEGRGGAIISVSIV